VNGLFPLARLLTCSPIACNPTTLICLAGPSLPGCPAVHAVLQGGGDEGLPDTAAGQVKDSSTAAAVDAAAAAGAAAAGSERPAKHKKGRKRKQLQQQDMQTLD